MSQQRAYDPKITIKSKPGAKGFVYEVSIYDGLDLISQPVVLPDVGSAHRTALEAVARLRGGEASFTPESLVDETYAPPERVNVRIVARQIQGNGGWQITLVSQDYDPSDWRYFEYEVRPDDSRALWVRSRRWPAGQCRPGPPTQPGCHRC